MGSMARSMLRTMAGGGGSKDRLPDRWKPSEAVDSGIRLYRYEVVSESGLPVKKLYWMRMLHFNGPGVAPDECVDEMSCDRCRKAAMLDAQGTEAARNEAYKLRATASPTFTIIPLDDPTRFRTYDARLTAFQGIMLELARAGGWRKGGYPKADAWAEGCDDGPLFEACVERGTSKVCGPNGQDLILTPTKKGRGVVWSVRREVDNCEILPFPEDAAVLSPEALDAKIKAAVARKNNMTREGD